MTWEGENRNKFCSNGLLKTPAHPPGFHSTWEAKSQEHSYLLRKSTSGFSSLETGPGCQLHWVRHKHFPPCRPPPSLITKEESFNWPSPHFEKFLFTSSFRPEPEELGYSSGSKLICETNVLKERKEEREGRKEERRESSKGHMA